MDVSTDDVETSYHNGSRGRPMVNVKVHDTSLAGLDWADLKADLVEDPKLLAMDPDEIRAVCERALEDASDLFEAAFVAACETNFEDAVNDLQELFGDGVTAYLEGRQGGWLVVDGLGDVDGWDHATLAKWETFGRYCRNYVADIPRAMAWFLLANCQDQIAGNATTMTIIIGSLGNDAFMDPGELARILTAVADRVEGKGPLFEVDESPLLDINGNVVGKVVFS
jgi:hypothetical protein